MKKTFITIQKILEKFRNDYRTRGNRMPAFYSFLRPLGWRINQILPLKCSIFLKKSGVLIKSGILLPRIRYVFFLFSNFPIFPTVFDLQSLLRLFNLFSNHLIFPFFHFLVQTQRIKVLNSHSIFIILRDLRSYV